MQFVVCHLSLYFFLLHFRKISTTINFLSELPGEMSPHPWISIAAHRFYEKWNKKC